MAGGPAPLIAAALLTHYGSSTSISIYIIICAAISGAALYLLPRTAEARFADVADPLAEPTATAVTAGAR
ncbi:MAG: hypothetical protein ABI181_04005 [Mycobacteriaceae bacterium]